VTAAWDPKRYQQQHSFVWQLGASLIELLAPRPGERILDLGCGTGQLTSDIAMSGASVVGLDKSRDMLQQATQNYPELTFVEGDAADFRFEEPFDAVFSNAALHWVKDHGAAVESIARALRPGGRFVAEFGGKGNTASIMAALSDILGSEAGERCPWNYPSIAEFAAVLEKNGLEVRQASLFDRPTRIEGEGAMENWLRMFCGSFFHGLEDSQTEAKLRMLVAHLRPAQYHDGGWTIDYRRLRVLATRN
jgi:trans-aconitate methyltransferase